mmetsp:Transcript_134707/g.238280  ORF Transcript_134707/g.238280 Transcript_134707/m.238280 type:complete len:262 (+) Transcript_134707:275-1060(+)
MSSHARRRCQEEVALHPPQQDVALHAGRRFRWHQKTPVQHNSDCQPHLQQLVAANKLGKIAGNPMVRLQAKKSAIPPEQSLQRYHQMMMTNNLGRTTWSSCELIDPLTIGLRHQPESQSHPHLQWLMREKAWKALHQDPRHPYFQSAARSAGCAPPPRFRLHCSPHLPLPMPLLLPLQPQAPPQPSFQLECTHLQFPAPLQCAQAQRLRPQPPQPSHRLQCGPLQPPLHHLDWKKMQACSESDQPSVHRPAHADDHARFRN